MHEYITQNSQIFYCKKKNRALAQNSDSGCKIQTFKLKLLKNFLAHC